MRKVQPYRFVPQTSYSVEQFDRWSSGSGFPPPEPPFCADAGGAYRATHDNMEVDTSAARIVHFVSLDEAAEGL